MLDAETKRRIDTARDILVGKVPDPKSQVEQITIALIYKFMDDMDAESEELGGARKFFAGEFARFGWARLMRSGLGGHEMLNLYAEAITRMPENPGIPALFRDIFQNAFLPYRDPETLRAFLKVIDEFTYDHSERLGDAFEYLLSVLGSQGDAGQFRTPRHIIDFIVSVVDPKKEETVLDPACGTAGFLISSYKHILEANTDDEGNSTLTPDERGKLAANFKGYDISPDMVRLSLVNLYLHGFADPHIFEYDTLTSEDRWNEYADVILANPPFMSPKGGIRPHSRFSVKSKRSEVLFVDYMAEHLMPAGRAGIIVPEGIIFQSQNAYKQLRKMLVENYLVAVISLPAGVFQPYSGVKTSILLLDRALAKKTDRVAFFKVENDGFDLGAQRREIAENDLPQVTEKLGEYLGRLRAGESVPTAGVAEPGVEYKTDNFQPTFGLIADKEKIAAGGEYNLSGERYRGRDTKPSEYFQVKLSDVCEINPQIANPAVLYPNSYFNYIDISCVKNESGQFLGANKIETDKAPSRARRLVETDDVLISTVRPNLRAFTILTEIPERAIASTGFAVLRSNKEQLLPKFLIYMLRHDKSVEQMVRMMGKGSYPSINQADVESMEIPLPPLEVQREIVAEIEGYQRVIDGARAVVDNYQPHIVVDPEWPMVPIKTVASVESGFGFPTTYQGTSDGDIPFLKVSDMNLQGNEVRIVSWNNAVSNSTLQKLKAKAFPPRTVIFPKIGAAIATNKKRILTRASTYDNNVMGIVSNPDKLLPEYLYAYLESFDLSRWASDAQPPSMRKTVVEEHLIPLPSLAIQQALVGEIEGERALVAANRELVERMEGKIRAAIGRVWG